MSEAFLNGFIPRDRGKAPIEVREDLTSVVRRISSVLPLEKIWQYYASTPNETGGRIVFPYARVDSLVITCRNMIFILRQPNLPPYKVQEDYDFASSLALRALVWVEIGFQGLDNLAESPASRNWTSAVGHFVNDSQRAERIMKEGRKLYTECLVTFVRYRTEKGITQDYFTEYNLEHLLARYKTR